MKTKSEILDSLKKELPHLKEKFNVKSIGLFGSYIRGKQSKKSDIDILVEFKESIGLFGFVELENYLSGKFGKKVDLVTSDAIKPIIKPSIMKEAVYA